MLIIFGLEPPENRITVCIPTHPWPQIRFAAGGYPHTSVL